MCVFWVHFQLVETVRRSISSGGQFAADEAGESGPPEDLPEKHWTGTVQLENCVWASVSAFESVPKFHLHPGTFNVLRLSHVVCVCVFPTCAPAFGSTPTPVEAKYCLSTATWTAVFMHTVLKAIARSSVWTCYVGVID